MIKKQETYCKAEHHRLDFDYLNELALHLTKASRIKYPDIEGEPNWKCHNPKDGKELLNAALRHIYQLYLGNPIDDEMQTPHEICASVNLMMYYHYLKKK